MKIPVLNISNTSRTMKLQSGCEGGKVSLALNIAVIPTCCSEKGSRNIRHVMYVRLQSKYKTRYLFVANDKHLGRIETVKAKIDTNVLSINVP